MTRYFYTDPLAVAWNSVHHGMQFEASAWTMQDEYEALYGTGVECEENNELANGRFYVHPDSLHLLEPKVGDVVQWLIHDGRGGHFHGAGAFGHYEGRGSVEVIVQRDGKPFHWPEQE